MPRRATRSWPRSTSDGSLKRAARGGLYLGMPNDPGGDLFSGISGVVSKIGELAERAITPEGYLAPGLPGGLLDLQDDGDYQPGYLAPGLPGGLLMSGAEASADSQPGYLAPGLPGGLLDLQDDGDYQPGYLAPGLPGGLLMPGAEASADDQSGYLAPGLPGGLLADDVMAACGHYAD